MSMSPAVSTELTKDEVFVSLVETAVKHFEDAQEHNKADNFDDTLSAVAVGIEHMSIAEAMKRDDGDNEAADLLLQKQEEYIEFSAVTLRRSSQSEIQTSPMKCPRGQMSTKEDVERKPLFDSPPPPPPPPSPSPPVSAGFRKINNSLEGIRVRVTDDSNEALGNSSILQALTFDENGETQKALSSYIKAVEYYLSFLESIESMDEKVDSSIIAKDVGEVLDRIETLRGGTTGPLKMFSSTDKGDLPTITDASNEDDASNEVVEKEGRGGEGGEGIKDENHRTIEEVEGDSRDRSVAVLSEDNTSNKNETEPKASHQKESAWLSSIWGALKGTIKVPHQGTSHPAPYAVSFTGQLNDEAILPPLLGSHHLRLFEDLEQQRRLPLSPLPPTSDASSSPQTGEDLKRKRTRAMESSWARCKACGAFVARDVDAIEDHILSCLEGGAVAPYDGMRVITWNMERGYRLGSIIEELKKEKADIIMLQEVDVGCDRSFSNDTGAEIALALGMHLVFASEKDHVNTQPQPKGHDALHVISEDDTVKGDKETERMEQSIHKNDLNDVNEDVDTSVVDVHVVDQNNKESSTGEKMSIESPPSTLKDPICNEDDVSSIPNEMDEHENDKDENPKVDEDLKVDEKEDRKEDKKEDEKEEVIDEHIKFHGGVEGIAILSRYPIQSTRTIHLPATHPQTPPTTEAAQNTTTPSHTPPFCGIAKSRTALRVETHTPLGLVVAYCCHLDAFAGRTARVHQLQPVLEDAQVTIWESAQNGRPRPHIIVGGDFNTHNHGLARFSRKMSGSEGMSGLGKTEAQWWDDVVFANTGLKDPFNKSDDSHNTWISVAGLTVWGGKIDWLLFSELTLVCDAHHISQGGKSSDHPYLRLDLRCTPEI